MQMQPLQELMAKQLTRKYRSEKEIEYELSLRFELFRLKFLAND